MAPTILLDENIDGYAEFLSRLLFSETWNDISSTLGVSVLTFEDVGLAKRTSDEAIWQFCQERQFHLLTDNRNQHKPDSLETMIQTQLQPTSLPIFTISDLSRFRSDGEYAQALVARLLEYLIEADSLRGTGRLYLP